MANKAKKNDKTRFDFSDSTTAIRKTAKSINAQVQETASEIAEDLKENGTQLADMAMEPVKKAYDKVADQINWEYLDLAKATKKANNFVFDTTEEIVDGVLENGPKWQGVAEKAINGGLKLAAKQQDMMFDTLETVKGQFVKSSKRFRKLLSNKAN
ncbi:MAG: hypothetical protein AAFZ63_21990 [Bacteroidota bacterium]